MARTFIRQATQIRKSDTYDDTIAPSQANYETNPVTIEDDLNALRSGLHTLMQNRAGNWYDDLASPTALDPGAQRGVNDLNADLHALERKRVLVQSHSLADIVVGPGLDYHILGVNELPSNVIAAVGAVTTKGIVAADASGAFGAHSLLAVPGALPVSPKNLLLVVDGDTRDPILSDGRKIHALLQVENPADGNPMSANAPDRAQLSFVRINLAGDDLEPVPVADIENKEINVSFVERKALADLNEQDFLSGAIVDLPQAATVTRQAVYDNQGVTPVDLTTDAILDLEGAGLVYRIRDDLEADLFRITEGSASGTSAVELTADVDTFSSAAAVNTFTNGATVAGIDVGVAANTIATAGGNDLVMFAGQDLKFDDSYRNGSTWGAELKLAASTAEWDAYEVEFGGELSLLAAITHAAQSGGRASKTYANVTAAALADADVGGTSGGANLDAQLPDMSGGDFVSDYDVFLNGNLLRGGADATVNNDYYPGTSLANGQLRFEFPLQVGDVICVSAMNLS